MKNVFLCAIAVALLGSATLVAQNPPVKNEAKTEKKACCDKKGDVKAEKCDKAEHKDCQKDAKAGEAKKCCKKDAQKSDKKCCKKDGEKTCCKDKAKAEQK